MAKIFPEDRPRFVSNNTEKPDIIIFNIGVKQSFTIGPLLFIFYIKYMKNSSKTLIFFNFADDTKFLKKKVIRIMALWQ